MRKHYRRYDSIQKRWIRLGEILHPAEYHTRFPKTHRAFEMLRNNIKVETFNGKIEAALLNRDIMTAKNLLKLARGICQTLGSFNPFM